MFKLKQEDYLAVHRTLFNITPRTIWRALVEDEKTPTEIVSIYPDEFADEVQGYIDDITTQAAELSFEIGLVYDSIKHIESRKEFAEQALKYPYFGELFLLKDGRDIKSSIMDRVYPPAVDKS